MTALELLTTVSKQLAFCFVIWWCVFEENLARPVDVARLGLEPCWELIRDIDRAYFKSKVECRLEELLEQLRFRENFLPLCASRSSNSHRKLATVDPPNSFDLGCT